MRYIEIITLAVFLYANFLFRSLDREERLSELPWKWVWPWIFLVVTFPLSALPFVVSALRGFGRVTPSNNSRPPSIKKQRATYLPSADAEGAARDRYLALRTGVQRSEAEKRHRRLGSTIKTRRETARDLSLQIKAAQKEISVAEAERSSIEESGILDETENGDPGQYLAEFEYIRSLPGVLGLGVEGNDLVVYIHSRVRAVTSGSLLDGGDWKVQCGSSDWKITRVRAPRGVTTGGMYGTSNFCFGDRASDVRTYMTSGNIGAALSLIIEGLNHVNPTDRPRVPEYFSYETI